MSNSLSSDDIANALTFTAYHYSKDMKNIKGLAKTYQAPETMDAFQLDPKIHITTDLGKLKKFLASNFTEAQFRRLMFTLGDISKFNEENFSLENEIIFQKIVQNHFSPEILDELIRKKFITLSVIIRGISNVKTNNALDIEPYISKILKLVNQEKNVDFVYVNHEKVIVERNMKSMFTYTFMMDNLYWDDENDLKTTFPKDWDRKDDKILMKLLTKPFDNHNYVYIVLVNEFVNSSLMDYKNILLVRRILQVCAFPFTQTVVVDNDFLIKPYREYCKMILTVVLHHSNFDAVYMKQFLPTNVVSFLNGREKRTENREKLKNNNCTIQ